MRMKFHGSDEQVIEKAVSYVTALFRADAGGHDAEHTLRVYRNAMTIAEHEPDCDQLIVALAALLHDTDDPKLFRTEDNANARKFLREAGVSEDEIGRICRVINAVSFSRNKDKAPDTAEGRIVQDADRLDALGAVGIARTFAYGGAHGRPMRESLQHFEEKLLLLKERMNTETGRRFAAGRHAFLLAFLQEFEAENGGNEDHGQRLPGR